MKVSNYMRKQRLYQLYLFAGTSTANDNDNDNDNNNSHCDNDTCIGSVRRSAS